MRNSKSDQYEDETSKKTAENFEYTAFQDCIFFQVYTKGSHTSISRKCFNYMKQKVVMCEKQKYTMAA